MRRAGRAGRGERARVEARVREILGTEAPATPARPTRHRAPGAAARLVGRAVSRVDVSRASAVAMAVVGLVVILLVGAWVLSSRPRALPVPGPSGPAATGAIVARSSGTAASTAPVIGHPASSTPSTLVIDVAGKVRRPGVYRLPPGSRVVDAVRAAGGALPGVDLSVVNLAAALSDGEQVAVAVAPAVQAAPRPGTTAASGTGPVHLNSATIEQLEALPGVGPALAQRILDFRSAHGGFTSIGQLNDVAGIGDAKFAALRDAVAL